MKELVHYAVYDRPSDYPNDYVVRCWRITPNTLPTPYEKPFMVTQVYREIEKKLLSLGLIRLERHGEDDPRTLETWI